MLEKFSKIVNMIMEQISDHYDQKFQTFKNKLSITDKIAFDFDYQNQITYSSNDFFDVVCFYANEQKKSIQSFLKQLDLINRCGIVLDSTAAEVKTTDRYIKDYKNGDISFCYDVKQTDQVVKEYRSRGIELNKQFENQVKNHIELTPQEVCKNWGIQNSFSAKTNSKFNKAYELHNEMKEKDPENHKVDIKHMGRCIKKYTCTCGFSYEVDSGD